MRKHSFAEENHAAGKVRNANSRTIFKDPVLCAQFLRYLDMPELSEVQPEDIEDVSEVYQAYLGIMINKIQNAEDFKRFRQSPPEQLDEILKKVLILRDLLTGTKRFGELKKSIGSVSQKVLTAQLRDMEESGLIHRQVYAEVPPRVEYSLTELGLSLKPILDAMKNWGEEYKSSLEEAG